MKSQVDALHKAESVPSREKIFSQAITGYYKDLSRDRKPQNLRFRAEVSTIYRIDTQLVRARHPRRRPGHEQHYLPVMSPTAAAAALNGRIEERVHASANLVRRWHVIGVLHYRYLLESGCEVITNR